MNIIAVVLLVVWIYVLTLLQRAGLKYWLFLVGSVGLFVFYVIFIQPYLTQPLQSAVAAGSGVMGNATGLYSYDFLYATLFIPTDEGSLSLYIDYECSGIIEIGTYLAMLIFFPVYNGFEKVVLSISGVLIILVTNMVRIFIICVMVRTFGGDVYFYAHTIVGRLFFYGITILVYFYVFTKAQVVRQRIGRFRYGLAN